MSLGPDVMSYNVNFYVKWYKSSLSAYSYHRLLLVCSSLHFVYLGELYDELSTSSLLEIDVLSASFVSLAFDPSVDSSLQLFVQSRIADVCIITFFIFNIHLFGFCLQ